MYNIFIFVNDYTMNEGVIMAVIIWKLWKLCNQCQSALML